MGRSAKDIALSQGNSLYSHKQAHPTQNASLTPKVAHCHGCPHIPRQPTRNGLFAPTKYCLRPPMPCPPTHQTPFVSHHSRSPLNVLVITITYVPLHATCGLFRPLRSVVPRFNPRAALNKLAFRNELRDVDHILALGLGRTTVDLLAVETGIYEWGRWVMWYR